MAELFGNNATQGLMGLIGGQSPTTPTQGGGMFDAYSPQNQTNMQMAMIADMIGNFAGKDVGAMKTMMPLAENARKLRLQGVEAQQLQQMRESSQGLIDEYSSAPQGVSGAAPARSPLSRLQQAQLQNALRSKDPGAVAKMLYEFGNRQYTREAAQFRQLTPEEVSARGLDTKKQWQVDGRDKVSQIGSGGVSIANDMYGNPLTRQGAEAFYDIKGELKAGSEDAANRIRPQRTMLQALMAKKPNGDPAMKTGAWAALTEDYQNMWNSFVDEFAPKSMKEALSAGDLSYAQIFGSTQKAGALISAALMKGNLSEKELQFSLDIQASLKNTRHASIFLTRMQIIREEARVTEYSHMLNWNANLSPEEYAKTLNKAGEQDGHKLNSLWENELNRYRRNEAKKLNSERVQEVWTDLGYVNLSGGGYTDATKYTADQLEALPRSEKIAVVKAMRALSRTGWKGER